jgi:hypothetical protein
MLEEEIATTKQNLNELVKKLLVAQKKNEELESELEFIKNRKGDCSTCKEVPRVRTYLT